MRSVICQVNISNAKIKAMKIIIEASGMDLTPALKTYIESKLSSLFKITKKFEGEGNGELFVEISRTTRHHNKGLVFAAEANLKFGKTLLRAEVGGENVRAAIDILKDELKREIINFKERFVSKGRRDERSAKKFLRLSKDARFRVK